VTLHSEGASMPVVMSPLELADQIEALLGEMRQSAACPAAARGDSLGHAAPSVVDRLIDGRAIGLLETIFGVPNLLRNGRKTQRCHGFAAYCLSPET
jgi:hypothetical protein